MSAKSFNDWRGATFAPALVAAGLLPARPYDLRHSFASLLLHEGRSVVYVARQMGHGANLTLSTYGHVIDELDGAAGHRRGRDLRGARKRAPEGDVMTTPITAVALAASLLAALALAGCGGTSIDQERIDACIAKETSSALNETPRTKSEATIFCRDKVLNGGGS